MNRILFESSEIVDGIASFGDARAEHVLKVLHGEVGQVIKTGEVDGKIGTAEIISINGGWINARCNHSDCGMEPWVDLVLAPPRPRVMKRLLPQLAAIGVGEIFLVGAKKVEKDFWGATLLKEENYRPLLIDGLMQAGTSALPRIHVRRNFRKFILEELDEVCSKGCRIVAHPYGEGKVAPDGVALSPRPVMAIGPEGGWTDDEVKMLEGRGFVRYSLGGRILKTDTATIALLAQIELLGRMVR